MVLRAEREADAERSRLAQRCERLQEAAQDVLDDIGPCDIRGRWCCRHQANECSVGALAALLKERP